MSEEEIITKPVVQSRIAALKKELGEFVEYANKQIAALNGAIQALEELIDPPLEVKKEQPHE